MPRRRWESSACFTKILQLDRGRQDLFVVFVYLKLKKRFMLFSTGDFGCFRDFGR